VGGEDHVGATFPDVEMVFQRARRLPAVRRRNHVENGFAIGGYLPGHGPKLANTPSEPAVDGDGAAYVEAVGASAAKEKSHAE